MMIMTITIIRMMMMVVLMMTVLMMKMMKIKVRFVFGEPSTHPSAACVGRSLPLSAKFTIIIVIIITIIMIMMTMMNKMMIIIMMEVFLPMSVMLVILEIINQCFDLSISLQ